MSEKDTIAAVSTPLGPGGIGIIRLSGAAAISIAEKIAKTNEPILSQRADRSVNYAKVVDPVSGSLVDEALVTVMRAPNSYTREDVVEINTHSGIPTLRQTLRLAISCGARLAEPGEFTKRAYLSGRIDLTQAQGVAGIIRAKSQAAARAAVRQADGCLSREISDMRVLLVALAAELEAAIDFADEDPEAMSPIEVSARAQSAIQIIDRLSREAARGRVADTGLSTAIIGLPNVGKSSLLNALSREDKAIVSQHPGTTRDIVEAQVLLGNIPLNLRDTAGWRLIDDELEAQGIERSRRAMAQADLILLVVDGSEPLRAGDLELCSMLRTHAQAIILINKADLPPAFEQSELPTVVAGTPVVFVSAVLGSGLDALDRVVSRLFDMEDVADGAEMMLADVRQEEALREAKNNLEEAVQATTKGFSEEITASLIKDAIKGLDSFTGRRLDEEILDKIFSMFCIGK